MHFFFFKFLICFWYWHLLNHTVKTAWGYGIPIYLTKMTTTWETLLWSNMSLIFSSTVFWRIFPFQKTEWENILKGRKVVIVNSFGNFQVRFFSFKRDVKIFQILCFCIWKLHFVGLTTKSIPQGYRFIFWFSVPVGFIDLFVKLFSR